MIKPKLSQAMLVLVVPILLFAEALPAQSVTVEYYLKYGFNPKADLSGVPIGMRESFSASSAKMVFLYRLQTQANASTYQYTGITANSDTTGAHTGYAPLNIFWRGGEKILLQPALGGAAADPCVELDRLGATDWEITGEAGPMICGESTFEARSRATGDTVVYFAPNVPISEGPDGLSGLPGLILRVEYFNRHLQASTIQRSKANAPVVNEPRPCTEEMKFRQLNTWLLRRKGYSTP